MGADVAVLVLIDHFHELVALLLRLVVGGRLERVIHLQRFEVQVFNETLKRANGRMNRRQM